MDYGSLKSEWMRPYQMPGALFVMDIPGTPPPKLLVMVGPKRFVEYSNR